MKKTIWILSAIILFLPVIGQATDIATRVRGHILLQVQSHGEAWYVNPTNNKRYYLKDGSTAYQVMRQLSLGINNENLKKIPVGVEDRFQEGDSDNDGLADKLEEGLGTDINNPDSDGDGYSDGTEVKNGYNPLGIGKIPTDPSLIDQLKGRILLQVESQGEAWYLSPQDGKRYYMKDGDQAYQIMRFLSLGITNTDLQTIPIAQDELSLLIFISPQYADDLQIKEAINTYIASITKEGWEAHIITLTATDNNNFRKIAEIIKNNNQIKNIKAAIMVGEDMDTALSAASSAFETPSVTPWSSLEDNFKVDDNGLIIQDGESETINVLISFIYPDQFLDYNTKSKQIIDVFNKFSKDRNKIHPNNFLAFLDQASAINLSYYTDDYKELAKYGSLHYKEHPSQDDYSNSFQSEYAIYAISGHGDPGHSWLGNENDAGYVRYSADYLDSVDSPLVTITGCNVGGWWAINNNESWYGSKIFTNNHLRVLVLGAPHQVCLGNTKYDFFAQALPDLMQGKTLAESLVGKKLCQPDDALIYGDPTFHFNF